MPPRPTNHHLKIRKDVCLYPKSHDFQSLSPEALALKIARHSRCTLCGDCTGLVPEKGLTVIFDTTWDSKESGLVGYITTCRCGHSVGDHAVPEDTSPEEYARRGRVAIRLDELLDVRPI